MEHVSRLGSMDNGPSRPNTRKLSPPSLALWSDTTEEVKFPQVEILLLRWHSTVSVMGGTKPKKIAK